MKKGYKHTKEFKDHLSKRTKEAYQTGKRKKLFGKDNPQYGKPGACHSISEKSKELIRQKALEGYTSGKRKKMLGELNPQFGKPHSNPGAISKTVKLWWESIDRDSVKGENSPVWKGGPKNHGYDCDEYRQACGRVRKRDNNTCQSCQQEGDKPKNRLEVHHKDGDDYNHADSNLVTLCMKCHKSRHKIMKIKMYRPKTYAEN